MILYRTRQGAVVADRNCYFAVERAWDELVNDDALRESLASVCAAGRENASLATAVARPLPPIGRQELWAAGVTYFRSRVARMEESDAAAGAGFYNRVYEAERPELFLKATPHRVVGPWASMHLRRDSAWIVPEPELVVVATRRGRIVGYTVGNDLSCRDIEGENPLYLPQAKTFNRCAAVGPGILVPAEPPGPDTAVHLVVRRNGEAVYEDETTLDRMKRTPAELVDFLFRDNAHPAGCLLMTGTGIVPPSDFSLASGDTVEISISGIGTLINSMD